MNFQFVPRYVCATELSRLVLLRETVTVCCESLTERRMGRMHSFSVLKQICLRRSEAFRM
jgi:hypothetical protein